MEETKETQTEPGIGVVKPMGETLLEIAAVMVRWRKFITRTVVSVTILTIIITLLLPKWYKATSSVFPAEQTNLFSGLEGVSSLVQSFSAGKKLSSLTGSNETDRYMAILKSDKVLQEVVTKFNLIDIYGNTNDPYRVEKTLKDLVGNTELEVQDEGNLSITVFDKVPQRAADIANYYVEVLNQTNSELGAQNARANREFVEQRYNKNLVDLRDAEESLKVFQQRYGVLALPEQMTASIKAGAEIYGQLARKEMELEILKQTLTADNPTVAEKQVEVDAVKKTLSDMSNGTLNSSEEMKIFIPLKQTPQLGVEYLRLYRNVEIQNKILQFITPVFEQAKVEENRSTPSVVVLDLAYPPERKAKPKVSMFALLAFVISLLFSLTVVFTGEALRRLQAMSPERYHHIVSTLQSDWF